MAISTIGTNALASSAVTRPKIGYAGAVLQVVNVAYNTYSNTTSTSFVATGLTATITPSSSSSKILSFVTMAGISKGGVNIAGSLALYKNGSVLLPFEDIAIYTANTNSATSSSSVTYLDSPATTSATTYAVYIKVGYGSGNIYWNNYTSTAGTTACTITLMEIAG